MNGNMWNTKGRKPRGRKPPEATRIPKQAREVSSFSPVGEHPVAFLIIILLRKIPPWYQLHGGYYSIQALTVQLLHG